MSEQKLPPSQSLQKATDELEKTLEANGAELGYEITFPIYRVIPDEVKLALSVLSKHGMKIIVVLNQKKK